MKSVSLVLDKERVPEGATLINVTVDDAQAEAIQAFTTSAYVESGLSFKVADGASFYLHPGVVMFAIIKDASAVSEG